MSQEFDYDVFISYSHQDGEVVHALAERLRDDGVTVWLDDWVLDPGAMIGLEIQRGLERSRVLLMCMSAAYFASDWAALEHHTLLFRDPTNERRRFVPLLLEDCERPDVIAQFLHIDWSDQEDEAYRRLLESFAHTETTMPSTNDQFDITSDEDTRNILISTITDACNDEPTFSSLAIVPFGEKAISGSHGNTLELWDLEKQRLITVLEGHRAVVTTVSISADGRRALSGSEDSTVKLWDLQRRSLIDTLTGHCAGINAVAISKDGQRAVSCSSDYTVKLWDLEKLDLSFTFDIHGEQVTAVAISADGRRAVTGSDGADLSVWDLQKCYRVAVLEGHRERINSVALSADGAKAVSGSSDGTIKVWDLERTCLVYSLEGHSGSVGGVAISADGRQAASCSDDLTVKLWDLHRQCLQFTFKGYSKPAYSVAMSYDGERLVSASVDQVLRVWNLASLKRCSSPKVTERYTNAKVVLVGESGVGKSGLALRLAEDGWRETGSTHGMSITKLDLPHDPAVPAEREVWLWDFAGQPDYRLIHQLYMDETALALMVVDPQKDEPFAPLGHWEQALSRAVRHDPEKLLVAARCDRGGYVVGQRDIDDYLAGRGYAGHVNTAAKLEDDRGCAELKDLIVKHVPWDRLPSTTTTVLFKALKDAVIEIKESGIVLIRVVELEQRLRLDWEGKPFEERDLRTVVGLLAGQGLVQPLDFGDFVLLQPEQINNYGSAVVRAARECESELAELPEQQVLEGEIDFKDMERLDPDDEKILLRAMLQTFLDRSLCYRVETPDGARLVFPAYFKFERPTNPGQPQIKVTYGFTGPIDEIYTTLVVRLHYSTEFESDRLWRYAANYRAFSSGDAAGLILTKQTDTTAKIQAYFDDDVSSDTEVLFIKYIHEHLKRYAEDVTRARDYACPHCKTAVENKKSVAKKLEEGKKDIICVECEQRVPLIDMIEEKFSSDEFLINVRRMDEQAQINLDNESLELILFGHALSTATEAGHIFRPVLDDDGIDGEILFRNDQGRASGQRLYLQLESGDSYLRERKRDGTEVFQIKNPQHADHWCRQDHPVMLVVRTADEKIRWMDVTDFLRHHGAETGRILFEGEPFTAINVHKRWRQMATVDASPLIA